MKKSVNISNKKARFTYDLLDSYVAGIVLTGTEIKSIRESKASIAESFCEFNLKGELFVINMTIQQYDFGNHYNHSPKAERKLLLNKKELKKLEKEVKKVEKEPALKEDSVLSIETEKATKETDDDKSSSLGESNLSNSEKRKTIKIDQQ